LSDGKKMTFWTRIEQWFKHRLFRLLEDHVGRKPLSPEQLENRPIRKILVIRQHDQLGDLLLSTPVFRALKNRFPDAATTVIVRSYTGSILQNHPFIDHVLVFYENLLQWSPVRMLRFIRKLRSGFDLAIVLNTVSHSMSSDTIAGLSKAPFILGSSHLPFSGCKRNFYYNLIAPYASREKHQSERNLDIIRYINADTKEKYEEIGLTEKEKIRAEQYFKTNIKGRRAIVGIHPGAGKIPNRWPTYRFAETADRLIRKTGAAVVLFQGPGEEDLIEAVQKEMKESCYLMPKMSLRDLAASFSCLDLFICNDTGVLHVAASVGAPTIALFGPTNPDLWKPPGDYVIAIRDQSKRVDQIKADQVVKQSLDCLNRLIRPANTV